MSWIEKQYPVGCEIILPDSTTAEVVGHYQDMPISAYERGRGVIVELPHGIRTEVPASDLYEDGSSKIK